MGPQLVRCGMQQPTRPQLTIQPASMGPQLVRCGMLGCAGGTVHNIMLQWGRNLFVAECFYKARSPALLGLASMGPQLVRCGMPLPCR